ncbi:hypothetical protein D9M68_881620 [compost metagenome]
MSTSPSITLQRQVEHTPPLHEYGSSIPCASAESSTLSLFLSITNIRLWPSCTTVTSHCPLPGAWRASWPVRSARGPFGAPKSSNLMFAFGMPRACRCSTTLSVMVCGPQTKA